MYEYSSAVHCSTCGRKRRVLYLSGGVEDLVDEKVVRVERVAEAQDLRSDLNEIRLELCLVPRVEHLRVTPHDT